MQTYTSLLAELRTEDQFQLDRHLEQFKKELNKGKSARDAYASISDACQQALSSAGINLLQKSVMVGVDDNNKLADGVQSINKEYAQKFMNQVQEYLE